MLIIKEDIDIHEFVLGAMQYGFGRMTMYPSSITSFIKRHWDELPENTKERIIFFTDKELKVNDNLKKNKYGLYHLGMKCDVDRWRDFLYWCREHYNGDDNEKI